MSDTTEERASKAYWFWVDPPRLTMPAILEVYVWESGEHRVETPLNVYTHWECAGGTGGTTAIEESILSPEEFMRLKATGILIEIGSLPAEIGELSGNAHHKPPATE